MPEALPPTPPALRVAAGGVAPAPTEADITRGWLLGALGILIFAATLPMTRLAVGDASAPQLPPLFVTVGRAAVAGLCSVAWLAWHRAVRPPRALWGAIALSAIGTTLGFPLFLALALREVDAMHAAVVTGVLPLATAAVAALALRQRPSAGFWLCALAGAGVVLAFAAWKGAGTLVPADWLLLGAVLSASVGYVAGARAAAMLGAEAAICWVLVLALPVMLPAALLLWPAAPARASAWAGFAYVSLFSMWIGFFAWYRALALGGVVRISQVQLLQPFLALLLAVPVAGERLDAATIGFTLAVMAIVWLGRRMPVGTPSR